MKMQAFSRQMIQTTNVPNATELEGDLQVGLVHFPSDFFHDFSLRVNVAFYWDIFPELELVLVCDECAAKEEFVHAEDSIGNDDDDLGDAFLNSLG